MLYGERGLQAIEVQRSPTVRREDLAGLATFGVDYASAARRLLYEGTKRMLLDGVQCLPLREGLEEAPAAM